MDWEIERAAFRPDGFCRHIRVDGVTLTDWNVFFRLLCRTEARLGFYRDGEVLPLPASIDDRPFLSAHRYLLLVELGGLRLAWRFEDIRTLDFELVPDAVTGPAQARLVLRVMASLGRRLGKEVLLLHPQDERALYRYRPGTGGIVYLGPPAGLTGG
jgi:hypothetical protein